MEKIEVLECQWCDSRFYLCRKCYHGQVYCRQSCRTAARKAQCHRAQEAYMSSKKGRERRAAAVAAYRLRQREGLNNSRSRRKTVRRNRSRYFPFVPSLFLLPAAVQCQQCGCIGRVTTVPSNAPVEKVELKTLIKPIFSRKQGGPECME